MGLFDVLRGQLEGTMNRDSSSSFYGPYLKFHEYDVDRGNWKGSVMVVISSRSAPTLSLQSGGGESCIEGEQLDEYERQWRFWRFDLEVEVTREEQEVTYWVEWDGEQTDEYTFHVAGSTQPWHWAFYSCNGWQADFVDMDLYGDITPLWKDLMAAHESSHMHALVGGGDQLYNDPVWEVAKMKEWLAIEDPKERAEQDMAEISEEAAQYYFNHYCEHFSTAVFKDALATIPSIMTWDDHDIFDGYGSYPHYLQACAVFQRVFREAERFYLLFQHHTTKRDAHSVGLFGNNTYSFLKLFGPQVAILGPDTRAGRKQERIISESDWRSMMDKLDSLPSSVQHLVVVCAVPFSYPELPAAEDALGFFSTENRSKFMDFFLAKTGLRSSILSQFGEPELSDDLADHWTSNAHIGERNQALRNFQELASSKKIRVTFLSGDVHVCAVGRITPDPGNEGEAVRDHRYMMQIVSSAIGNTPPPAGLAKALNAVSRPKSIEDGVYEEMVPVFKSDYADMPKILPRRNWCDVTLKSDGMHFELRVEDDPKKGCQDVRSFDTLVPPLISGGYGVSGGSYQSDYGEEYQQQQHKYGRDENQGYGRQQQQCGRNDDDDQGYGCQQQSRYGRDNDESNIRQQQYGRNNDDDQGYGRQQQSRYGQENDESDIRQQQYGRNNDDDQGYGRQQQQYGRENDAVGYGHQQQQYGRNNDDEGGYGRQQQQYGRGYDEGGYGRQQQPRRDDEGEGYEGKKRYGGGGYEE